MKKRMAEIHQLKTLRMKRILQKKLIDYTKYRSSLMQGETSLNLKLASEVNRIRAIKSEARAAILRDDKCVAT